MSDFDNMNSQNLAAEARSRDIDEGLRIYMLKVYNYMSVGLLVTALAAFFGASSGIYQAIANTPLVWVVMFAPLGLVLYLSARINKMSANAARTTFFTYSGIMGFSLSYILLVFTQESIVTTFLVTSASFGALSLYGYTTKKDLSGMRSFLLMGLFGIILASIVNIFMASAAMHFAISVIGVLLFAALTAYDTQAIKQMYYAGDTRETAEKKAVLGALRLYLDFVNMFLFLLQFLGNRD